jgi:hypothetical protein
MNKKLRNRSESICELLCFQRCEEKTPSEGPTPAPQDFKITKLSLRRVIEDEQRQQHKFARSISDKNLNSPGFANRLKAETSRSQHELKELLLFKKKNKLEHEIQQVDQEMSRLTLKYERNITELRAIKKELESLRSFDH